MITGGDLEYSEPLPVPEVEEYVKEQGYALLPPQHKEHYRAISVNEIGPHENLMEASISPDTDKGPESRVGVNLSFDMGVVQWYAPEFYRTEAKEFLKEFTDDFDLSQKEPNPEINTWSDFVGYGEQKRRVQNSLMHLENPHLFRSMGIESPESVLLHGPPGNGKSTIGSIIEDQTDVYFAEMPLGEVINGIVGESEEYIRDIFSEASENSPAIIFIDELDAIGSDRDETTTSTHTGITSTLQQEISGLDNRDNVQVFGTTNKIEDIEPALLRGGRFGTKINIPYPDKEARVSILKHYTRQDEDGYGLPVEQNIDYETLADQLDGRAASDIESIANSAARRKIREVSEEVGSVGALHPEKNREELIVTQEEMLETIEQWNGTEI